ncbi:MAG: TIM barrel protein, partial [Nanoarchaeota archaeon]|nr:TIM barrel protein [Nanoarchaeota archaeon]
SDYDLITQNEAFIQASQDTQEGTARGWGGYYGKEIPEHIEALGKLYKAREFYLKLDQSLPESEKWKLLKKQGYPGTLGELVPSESKSPLQILDDAIKSSKNQLDFGRDASVSQLTQANEINQNKRHLVDPVKYVDRFTTRGYAEAAIHALDRSHDPSNPVVLTLEHIFPERFGGHPEEHMWIVKRAREQMVNLLTERETELGASFTNKPSYKANPKTGEMEILKQPNPFFRPGLNRDEARRLAEQHIKITIDTGHLNLWRKYFQPKPGATPEQNESEFRGWYLGEIEKMAREKMIGNVHLVDNYGYQDEHLAPGQGNAPVTEVMQILKKYGYDKAFTVEPGADASTDLSDFHGLMKAWRHFGSPIYGMGGGGGAPMSSGGRGQSWGEVQYSYFGQNQPPYFVFGAYAPSNDWTLWSQTPME